MAGIVLRRALKALIAESGLPTDEPKIELRPAQDRLGEPHEGEERPLGNCIRMPTMPHQRTKLRFPLIDPINGAKLSGKITELVEELDHTRAEVFIDLAERAPLPPLGPPPRELRFPYGVPEGEESASDILRELWGALRARPGKAIRCPAHDDQHPSLSILKDDQRAICKAPGCILNNDGRGRGTYELRTMAPRQPV
jgi:hypothetical protein